MTTLPRERMLMKEYMKSACAKYGGWAELDADTQDKIIRRIERCCFNKAVMSSIEDGIDRRWANPKFVGRYSAECYRVLSNIDHTSSVRSDYLISEIIAGRIDAAEVAELSSYELCPMASQAERDEIDLRMQQKVDMKISRAYTCSKCHKNETQLKRYQASRADEDSTISIRCINCGHVWRR